MRSSAAATRRTRAAESFGNAAECIGAVEPGMSLFAITRGQWSMIDAILHVLDQVGAARLTIWTWTIAEYEVQVLQRLMLDSRLTGATLVIDQSVREKNLSRATAHDCSVGIVRQWKDIFGPDSVRYVRCHAKIATIESASGLRVLCRGSMNLNFNPRFEQFDLTEGGPDFDLVREIEAELPILPDTCTKEDAHRATRTTEAFDASTLEMFSGVKVWAK